MHPAFQYRALATLSIPLVVLVVSGVALAPRQTGRLLGLEEFVPLALQLCGLLVWLQQARASMSLGAAYVIRTAFGVTLISAAMFGAGLLFSGFEIGLGILAAFCLLASFGWPSIRER